MAEPTPGHWVLGGLAPRQRWITTADPRYGIIATVHGNVGPGPEPDQREANARFIARAPRMLAALEAIRTALDRNDVEDAAQITRAALAAVQETE